MKFTSASRVLGWSLMAISLTACTVTRTNSRFNLAAPPAVALSKWEEPPVAIQSLIVTEGRTDFSTMQPLADSRILLNKRNYHGSKKVGVYAIDKPLTELIGASFDDGLNRVGVLRKPASPFQLKVRIDAVNDPVATRGAHSGNKVLILRLTLFVFDERSKRNVWQQDCEGESLVETAVHYRARDFLRSLPGTLTDATTRCLSVPGLRLALLE